jgi:hypothetical protein
MRLNRWELAPVLILGGFVIAGGISRVAAAGMRAPSVPTVTPTPTHHIFPTVTPTPTPDPTLLRVSAIAPGSGPASGGTSVTITGANFVPGASVEIGGSAATGVVVSDSADIEATVPALQPGFLTDVRVTNPSLETAALHNGWFADFADVPGSNLFHDDVERIARAAITAGCGGGNYCPAAPVTRANMAVLVLKTKYSWMEVPDPCTGIFSDVPCPSPYADWIELLAEIGVTAGCGADHYCPDALVTREQSAVILLKARHGYDVVPPPCQGVFADVACPGPFADWIEMLASEGITAGCGGGNFCPGGLVLRGPLATFLARSFYLTPAGLPFPGLSGAKPRD